MEVLVVQTCILIVSALQFFDAITLTRLSALI